jgi:hypothetical protein
MEPRVLWLKPNETNHEHKHHSIPDAGDRESRQKVLDTFSKRRSL